MWKADPADLKTRVVVSACADGTQDKRKAERLRSSSDFLEQVAVLFDHHAQADSLSALAASELLPDELSREEMIWFYDQQLARRSSKARPYYDKILLSAKHNLCSYCRYGQATTLDHVLPKSVVPGLSIEPKNLVPACGRCNHKLSNTHFDTPEEPTFHPYFVSPVGRWLRAEVVESTPVFVRFWADPSALDDPLLASRILRQFERLELADLFSQVSAVDLSEVSRYVEKYLLPGGMTAVRGHLRDNAAVCFEDDPNSRKGALLEALSLSDWYCGGSAFRSSLLMAAQ